MEANGTRPAPGSAAAQPQRSWKDVYLDAIGAMSPGVLAGMVGGAVIGGLGGRLAMFVLRLTSSDALHGAETDDGFTMGSFTGDTVFLIAATMLVGMMGGLLYMGVRGWLPLRLRPALYALLCATLGGTAVINPGGIDFTALEPLSLAVVMFVALLAFYGAAVSLIAERLAERPGYQRSRWAWTGVGPLFTIVGGGPGLIIVAAFILIGALNRSGEVTRLWASAPVVWLGRAAFAAVVAASSYGLARDVSQVL